MKPQLKTRGARRPCKTFNDRVQSVQLKPAKIFIPASAPLKKAGPQPSLQLGHIPCSCSYSFNLHRTDGTNCCSLQVECFFVFFFNTHVAGKTSALSKNMVTHGSCDHSKASHWLYFSSVQSDPQNGMSVLLCIISGCL